eukprot:449948-Ditylum_brightwellii.AAC.1
MELNTSNTNTLGAISNLPTHRSHASLHPNEESSHQRGDGQTFIRTLQETLSPDIHNTIYYPPHMYTHGRKMTLRHPARCKRQEHKDRGT